VADGSLSRPDRHFLWSLVIGPHVIEHTQQDGKALITARCGLFVDAANCDGKGREMVIMRLGVRWLLILVIVFIAAAVRTPYLSSAGAELPMVDVRETKAVRQHLEENVAQIERALADLGYPIAEGDRALLEATASHSDDDALSAIQEVLDRYTLLMVHIDDEAWFKVTPASPDPNSRRLKQKQWKTYLVKVNNEGRFTSPLEVGSPQALSIESGDIARNQSSACQADEPHPWSKWFLLRLYKGSSGEAKLSGRELDYFILQLCSLDAGTRAAEMVFYLGGGQVNQGGRYGDTNMLFYVDKAVDPKVTRRDR
jgi:hypothetical protein